MRDIESFVNIIDVESTCWEPKESKPEDQISEIIEIGISVVNTNSLQIVKTSSIIIKPEKSKISDFCTKLTTLTTDIVDAGIPFQKAVEILKRDYKSHKTTFISWGDYDRKMFEKNCKNYNVDYPFGPRHINLKNCFSLFNGFTKEFGLDYALNYYNLILEGTHHRGEWDAHNTAKIFIKMLKTFRKLED